MRDYFVAFTVERLKFKRTLALWLTILTPVLAAGLQFMIFLNMEAVPWEGVTGWIWLLRSAGPVWALFAFPMLIAVVTALMGQFEHGSGGWKRLYALPVARPAIGLAKLVWAHLLFAITNIWLMLLLLLVGWVGHLINPEFGFASSAPVLQFVWTGLKFYLAGGLVISFHHWLANRSASFTLAMGVGIAGTFIGMIQAKGWYQKLFPWKLMLNTTSSVEGVPELALTLGIAGGMIVAALSMRDLSRREII